MSESGAQVWTIRPLLFDLKAMCCETHDCQGTTRQLGHHTGIIDHYQKGHACCVKALWGTRADCTAAKRQSCPRLLCIIAISIATSLYAV
jgi:hypothetical protein